MTQADRIARRVRNAARLRKWRKARGISPPPSQPRSESSRVYDQKRYHTTEGRANTLLQSARRRSRAFGRSCQLSRAWVLEHLAPMRCEATGTPLSFDAFSPSAPTIDRRNNSWGYTPSNCWVVCRRFNFRKRGKTVEEGLALWGTPYRAQVGGARSTVKIPQ